MNDVASLVSAGLAFFIVAVSPGPANISNAAVAMHYGRKTSLIYGVGLTSGLVFWGLVAASGMGAVLQSSVYILMVLKVLGGLYLLWLAFLSVRSAEVPNIEQIAVSKKQRWFLRGWLLNTSNPKTVIAWMAALSVGLKSSDDVYAIAAAFSICLGVGLFTNMVYSLVFSLGGMMRIYQRCHRWINRLVAGLFALAGVNLIRSAFTR